MSSLPFKDILHTNQFSQNELFTIFHKANEMEAILTGDKKGGQLSGKLMASLFYEPSTRTRLSFEAAMKRLGGKVLTVAESGSSSLSKGESLEDNARVMSAYADILVMRHPDIGSVQTTAQSIEKPVINAGDGPNQHPTQALLDVYTIQKECGRLDKLHIAIAGDLRYGRTAHSLVYLLGLFPHISFSFISDPDLQMPKKILSFCQEQKIPYTMHDNHEDGLINADCIYLTRIQKERFVDISKYEQVKNRLILHTWHLDKAKPKATILHPLPRVDEVSPEVDELPNAAFFRQAQNGVPIRMALLTLLCT